MQLSSRQSCGSSEQTGWELQLIFTSNIRMRKKCDLSDFDLHKPEEQETSFHQSSLWACAQCSLRFLLFLGCQEVKPSRFRLLSPTGTNLKVDLFLFFVTEKEKSVIISVIYFLLAQTSHSSILINEVYPPTDLSLSAFTAKTCTKNS